MAIQIEVTKGTVTDKGDSFKNDFHTITMEMRVTDDAVEVINKTYSTDYKSVHILADKMAEIKAQMEKDIATYKDEKSILDQLDNEASKIQTDLSAKEVK